MTMLYNRIQRIGRRLGFEVLIRRPPHFRLVLGSHVQLRGDYVNWVRVPMYLLICKVLDSLGESYWKGKNVIEIGGSEGTIAKFLKAEGCNYTAAPPFPLIDVESLPYDDSSFDGVVVDQVMEHVKHPWLAAREIQRILKPGGICVCTSVFMYPYHPGNTEGYDDYYRFSPAAWKVLFDSCRVISSEGWGNADLMRLAYESSDLGFEGLPRLPVPQLMKTRMYSKADNLNYVTTWCIVMKK